MFEQECESAVFSPPESAACASRALFHVPELAPLHMGVLEGDVSASRQGRLQMRTQVRDFRSRRVFKTAINASEAARGGRVGSGASLIFADGRIRNERAIRIRRRRQGLERVHLKCL